MHCLITFTIASLFFPIWIRFQGRDAITTSSIIICILFIIYIGRVACLKKIKPYYFKALILLFLSTLISLFSVESYFLGPALRKYVQFWCSLMLFYVVVNYYIELSPRDKFEKSNRLITAILVLFAIQIALGIILYCVPDFGRFLSIFSTRNNDIVVTNVASGAKRLKGIIVSQESFAEILALLCPVLLYKLYKDGSLYYLLYPLFFIGVLLTATRSGVLLFFLGSIIYILFNFKRTPLIFWFLATFTFLLGLIVSVSYLVDIWRPLLDRFYLALEIYSETGSVVAAIDRKSLWDIANNMVISDIKLFGHGMPTVFNGEPFDIHNLYMTILHQFGIVGFILFFWILIKIIISLYSSYRRTENLDIKNLIFSCMLSILLLFINEFKYEFNRMSSYQQVVWAIFGVYFLASKSCYNYGKQDCSIII